MCILISATFFYDYQRNVSYSQLAILVSSLIKFFPDTHKIRVFDGLVLFEYLGEKLSAVKQEGNNQLSFKISRNNKVSKLAYIEFSNEISNSRNSIKQPLTVEDFNNGIYAITVVGMNVDFLIELDEFLVKNDGSYKGFALLDLLKPQNYILFIDYMEDNCMLLDGRAIISDRVFQCDFLEYISNEQCNFVDIMTYESMSPSAKLNNDYHKGINDHSSVDNHTDEKGFWYILVEYAMNFLMKNENNVITDFEIEAKERLSIRDICDMTNKLLGYCLNQDNEKGRDKARLFEGLLGFNKKNFSLLESQLKHGLKDCILKFNEINKYGLQFTAFIDVKGANGISKTIESGWIYEMKSPDKIRLTTAYLANKKKQTGLVVENSLFVEDSVNFYTHLLQKAKEYANVANDRYEIIPMIIGTSNNTESIVPEGEFGYSILEIYDNKFSSWLISHHEAYQAESVCRMHIDIQSNYQLSKNYAEHMAEVFDFNGISTKVIAIYD